MPFSRYEERTTIKNEQKLYKKQIEERGVNYIEHHSTPDLGYPTTAQMASIETEVVIWKIGQRYWKIAEEFYGDPQYWWVIAWYNKKPTEASLKGGDLVIVPQPLETVLKLLDV